VREARECRFQHSYILDRYQAAIGAYSKLPRWVTQYVRGYRDALINNLYRTDLFHAYEWKGELYEKWDSMPEEMKAHIRSTPTDDLIHGHYWKGSKSAFFLGSK
jgi:hypothetical protein